MIRKQLFDQFESAREATMEDLARDVADILGARRALPGKNLRGVLNWGLPPMNSFSPQVDADRKQIASYMRDAIIAFEPRLEGVDVVPVEGSSDFSFQLKAQVIEADGNAVTLRIITPRRGGGLGAEVAVIGGEGGKTAVLKDAEGNEVPDNLVG